MAKIIRVIAAVASLTLLALAVPAEAAGKAKKVQASTCPTGRIKCVDWCKKYREPQNQASCRFTHPGSCMQRHGGLDVCVRDGSN